MPGAGFLPQRGEQRRLTRRLAGRQPFLQIGTGHGPQVAQRDEHLHVVRCQRVHDTAGRMERLDDLSRTGTRRPGAVAQQDKAALWDRGVEPGHRAGSLDPADDRDRVGAADGAEPPVRLVLGGLVEDLDEAGVQRGFRRRQRILLVHLPRRCLLVDPGRDAGGEEPGHIRVLALRVERRAGIGAGDQCREQIVERLQRSLIGLRRRCPAEGRGAAGEVRELRHLVAFQA